MKHRTIKGDLTKQKNFGRIPTPPKGGAMASNKQYRRKNKRNERY